VPPGRVDQETSRDHLRRAAAQRNEPVERPAPNRTERERAAAQASAGRDRGGTQGVIETGPLDEETGRLRVGVRPRRAGPADEGAVRPGRRFFGGAPRTRTPQEVQSQRRQGLHPVRAPPPARLDEQRVVAQARQSSRGR
jgi:hypothetical protein